VSIANACRIEKASHEVTQQERNNGSGPPLTSTGPGMLNLVQSAPLNLIRVVCESSPASTKKMKDQPPPHGDEIGLIVIVWKTISKTLSFTSFDYYNCGAKGPTHQGTQTGFSI